MERLYRKWEGCIGNGKVVQEMERVNRKWEGRTGNGKVV
jgi:hypothetical protein